MLHTGGEGGLLQKNTGLLSIRCWCDCGETAKVIAIRHLVMDSEVSDRELPHPNASLRRSKSGSGCSL